MTVAASCSGVCPSCSSQKQRRLCHLTHHAAYRALPVMSRKGFFFFFFWALCRVCHARIIAEIKITLSSWGSLMDENTKQLNNQISVLAATSTGTTTTAPLQLSLIRSFFFFFLLCWTDSGTDGLVCCVTVLFFPRPLPNYLASSVFYQTVGSGSRLSVLPVLLWTGLGNCFSGSCQVKKPHLWTRDANDVKGRLFSFIPPQKHISALVENIILQTHI